MHVIRTDCKYVLWFKIDRIIFDTVEDVVVEVCYIPPEGNKYSSNDCFFLEKEQELINLPQDNKHVCLMDDFNARTWFFTPDAYLSQVSVCDDFSESETRERSVVFWETFDPFTKNKDVTVNNVGYNFTKFCKNNDLYMVNNRLGSDKNIGVTCRNRSTVDYVIASVNIFEV